MCEQTWPPGQADVLYVSYPSPFQFTPACRVRARTTYYVPAGFETVSFRHTNAGISQVSETQRHCCAEELCL